MINSILGSVAGAAANQQPSAVGGGNAAIQARITQLQAEIASLQQQLGQPSTVGEALAPPTATPSMAPIKTTTSGPTPGTAGQPAQSTQYLNNGQFDWGAFRADNPQYANGSIGGALGGFNAAMQTPAAQQIMRNQNPFANVPMAIFSDRRLKTNVKKC